MKIIRTVLGDIAPVPQFTHCHDHVWIGREALGKDCPVSSIDCEEASLEELTAFFRCGGRLLVDAQPTGSGGSPSVLARLSRASGVGIVASTGFHKLCFYRSDSPIRFLTEEELKASFCRDVLRGHCGVIKVAADVDWLAGRYEMLHRAAADAAVLTGAPVLCHIEKGADPSAVLDFYAERGVSENSLLLCHCDRAVPDVSAHLKAAARGAYLEYDTIARPKYHDDDTEIALIAQVVAAGFGDRLLLGLDTTRERLAAYGNPCAPGLCYLRNSFVPRMLRAGLSPDDVARFTELNPAEALAFSPREG